jgi:hypothetical protein
MRYALLAALCRGYRQLPTLLRWDAVPRACQARRGCWLQRCLQLPRLPGAGCREQVVRQSNPHFTAVISLP